MDGLALRLYATISRTPTMRPRTSKWKASEIQDLEGVVTLPDARELLSALPAGPVDDRDLMYPPSGEVRLRAAGLPIPERLLTCDDVINGKPDPEPYLKGAALLGVAATDCVVVEDVPAGIRAGKAAGARVIACRTTACEAELEDAGADWIVDSCKSISVSQAKGKLRLVLTDEHVIHNR